MGLQKKKEIFSLSDNKKNKNEVLKLIAIITMIIDHIGIVFFPGDDAWRMIGRLTFPIFAYQIAQGYLYTSNYRKYLFRIWIFALISQIPYMLLFNTTKENIWGLEMPMLNVMVTFMVALFLIDKVVKREFSWFFPLFLTPFIICFDYSLYGLLLPLAFYLTRGNKTLALISTSLLTILYSYMMGNYLVLFAIIGIMIVLFLPKDLLTIKVNKYLFYWFYPVHLIILVIIKYLLM